MNRVSGTFPDRSRLWKGAVLATIAHAIGVAADPLLAYELSWDGINYNRQDSQGTRGTVTFAPSATVAVFRDDSSERCPWRMDNQYDLDWFFRGIPAELMVLARNEALQYVLDEYEGRVSPIITAAFWGDTNTLRTAEPWAEVIKHGAHLISTELEEPETAIDQWTEYHDLSGAQSDLLSALYSRRIKEKDGEIILDRDEYAVLVHKGVDGIEATRELLAAAGIRLPAQRFADTPSS